MGGMKPSLLLPIASVISVLLFATSTYAGGRYYGGGRHVSHGGSYPGGQGSSHKGGHYRNANTGNQYGRHK